MGEAKRRKRLDPNYGKSSMMGWRTELEWKKILGFPEGFWVEVKHDLRVVNTLDDVDESLDRVWIYKDEKGQEVMKPTGIFIDIFPKVSKDEKLVFKNIRVEVK